MTTQNIIYEYHWFPAKEIAILHKVLQKLHKTVKQNQIVVQYNNENLFIFYPELKIFIKIYISTK